MTLEEAYLHHIILHVASGDRDGSALRTYLDSWFAYSVGPRLLKGRNQTPQWLNKGDLANLLKRDPKLREELHAVSSEAEQRIIAGEVGDLAKDHSIPIARLQIEIAAMAPKSPSQLREFLMHRYRVAIVTQQEHARLGAGDRARQNLKIYFGPEHGAFARYECQHSNIEYRLTARGRQAEAGSRTAP